jgi:o-succinylbenzoate synthase
MTVRPVASPGQVARVRIERVHLRLVRLPLVRSFETSVGRTDDRPFLLVTVSADGVTGWGECVAEARPFYSAETNETAWHVLREFLVPMLCAGPIEGPGDLAARFAPVRGHPMAKAALEMATWDLWAKRAGEPLWRLLGGSGRPVPSGVSIGIQASLEALVERVGQERAAGYRRVKIKIKPGWDLRAVEAVRRAHPDVPLMVDANAAYTLADAEHLATLDAARLLMIEQPLHHEDVRDHAALQARLSTPVCLDESIHSARRAVEALALGACRVVNIKPGRVGGHGEARQVHDACARHGVPVWAGGMLESGIGRAHNLHLATLPNYTLPGDIAASRRYYDPDLIDPPIDVSADGTVVVPPGPGIGVHIAEARVARATERSLTLTS